VVEVVEGLQAVTVHIRDIERARRFYSEVLGLKEVSYDAASFRAAFALPGTTTQLTMHIQAEGEGGREPGTVSGIIFAHHDPAGALEEVRRRGGKIVGEAVTFERPFGTVTLGVVADPDGNEFLIRHIRPPASTVPRP
jgi:predicted enzyme related to lactoylglutathione lyase